MKAKLIRTIVAVLDNIIPKKSNLIIFGARGGTMYYDNSKILFEYIRDNHPEFECVWLSTVKNICGKLTSTYNKDICFNTRTRLGLWKFLRARFAVMSHGFGDFEG